MYWQLDLCQAHLHPFFIIFYFNDRLYNGTYEKLRVLDQCCFYILRKSFLHGISLRSQFGSIVQGVAFRDPMVLFPLFQNPHVEHFC